MSTENFLRGIDESLVKFAKFFKREGFHNEKHLKCLILPEDLSVILHGEKVTLAERRQMEDALKTLKQNDSKKTEFYGPSTHPEVKPSTASALCKIEKSVEAKLEEKKSELAEITKVYENLLAPVSEPEPCGIRVLRCSNCHRIGHKAEGNSGGKSCPNEKCTNYFKCGQERFHNDFRQEKRQVEENLKTLKREIKDLESEKSMVSSYHQNTNSFASVMRERLRKSNPSKYSKSSSLLKDIIILKKHYKNEIPPPSKNDADEFATIIDKSCSQASEYKNAYSEPSPNSPEKNAHPKRVKIDNPYQCPQFFPLPFPSPFYPYPYPLSNFQNPFQMPTQAPMQLSPTPIMQSAEQSLFHHKPVPTSTISSKEDNFNPFENKLHLLASAASVQSNAKDTNESDGEDTDKEERIENTGNEDQTDSPGTA